MRTWSSHRVLLIVLCATIAFLAASLWSTEVALAAVRNPKGVAVIVGNRDYRHPDIPAVSFAHRDADAFRRYVVDVLGFDLKNIIDLRDATRAQLLRTFGRKQKRASDLWAKLLPNREWDVVVFYSGHGVPGLNDGKGYLLPVDVTPRAAQEEGYPIDLLYEKLGNLKNARSVQVYLEACFSGASAGGQLVRSASPVVVRPALPKGLAGKVTAVSASGADQIASWDVKARHGLFTHHLLEALYGKGDTDGDKKVTAKEVKAYLDGFMTRAAWLQHQREQDANVVSAPGTVLASAPPDGFPERPSLDGGTGVGKKDETKTEEVAKVVKADPGKKEAALDREKRKLVQRGLASLGLYKGFMDGAFGPKTSGAIRTWQKAKGYGETGKLTKEQADALVAQGDEAEKKAARERVAREKEEAGRRAREAAERERSAREAREREKSERERALLMPGRAFRDCPDCPEMVVVPAGSYLMGSPHDEKKRQKDEGPRHRVTISQPFAVGKYEVTRREFGAFVHASGHVMGGGCWVYDSGERKWKRDAARSWRSPGFEQTDLDPVACVSWRDAQAYVNWVSEKTGKRYRLPSEGEWEYAARGGTRTSRYWGNDASAQCAHANGADGTLKAHYSNWRWVVASCRDGFVHTAPAGSFSANAFGLHDVLGNVWEWVEDCWNERYVGAPSDGSPWTGGDCGRRVLRGGSWFGRPGSLRSANRGGDRTGFRNNGSGFRVARTLAP